MDAYALNLYRRAAAVAAVAAVVVSVVVGAAIPCPCCCSDGAQTTIDELHRKGKWVSCYISVGTMESWRADAGAFPSEALGLSWDDWVGETFVDVSQQSVRDIMQARIEKAAGMNCDAIEPDNMSVSVKQDQTTKTAPEQ